MSGDGSDFYDDLGDILINKSGINPGMYMIFDLTGRHVYFSDGTGKRFKFPSHDTVKDDKLYLYGLDEHAAVLIAQVVAAINNLLPVEVAHEMGKDKYIFKFRNK